MRTVCCRSRDDILCRLSVNEEASFNETTYQRLGHPSPAPRVLSISPWETYGRLRSRRDIVEIALVIFRITGIGLPHRRRYEGVATAPTRFLFVLDRSLAIRYSGGDPRCRARTIAGPSENAPRALLAPWRGLGILQARSIQRNTIPRAVGKKLMPLTRHPPGTPTVYGNSMSVGVKIYGINLPLTTLVNFHYSFYAIEPPLYQQIAF